MKNNLNKYNLEIIQALRVGMFLSLRQIRRGSVWTTSLIVFIMMLTFLNLVVVSGLLVGLITGSYKQYQEKYSGEIIVTPQSGRTYIENSTRLLEYLKTEKSVLAYSARYSTPGTLFASLDQNPPNKEKPNQGTGSIVGINPETEENTTHFSENLIDGAYLNSSESGYILIGSNLIKEFSTFGDIDIPGIELLENIQVGDKVRLTLAQNTEAPVSKIFIIKGIVKSKVDQVSQRIFITDNDFRSLLEVNQWDFQEIAIRTTLENTTVLTNDLKNHMLGYAVRIQTSEESIPSFLRNIETTFNILGNALSSIALVVASITVFIVIFINAITRRKYIGIMKGIGISPLAIKLAYVFQGIFYGVVGSAIGLSITFGFLKPFFENNPIDFPFSDGILVATPMGALVRVIILLTVTILAGFIPASLIVRKNTLDSILGR